MGKNKKTPLDLLRDSITRQKRKRIASISTGPFLCPNCQEITLEVRHNKRYEVLDNELIPIHKFVFYCGNNACRFRKKIEKKSGVVDVMDVYNEELLDKFGELTVVR